MEHLHHRWLQKVGEDLQEDYEQIRDELAANPGRGIQFSGHQAESVWERLLAAWLPSQYEIGTRKYVLFEREVDGVSKSGEIDIVVFHPAYPTALRARTEVMISGLIAAFSVKLTLTPDGLREAIDTAVLLHRAIQPRPGAPIGDLVSPLIVGGLAQSQRDMGSNPEQKITRIIENEGLSKIQHPRDELDLVCVADLNCWLRHPTVDTSVTGPDRIAAHHYQYQAPWVLGDPWQGIETPPVAMFVTALWLKLANRDRSLEPIANGFRYTGTIGSSSGSLRGAQLLAPMVDPETFQNLLRNLPGGSVCEID